MTFSKDPDMASLTKDYISRTKIVTSYNLWVYFYLINKTYV